MEVISLAHILTSKCRSFSNIALLSTHTPSETVSPGKRIPVPERSPLSGLGRSILLISKRPPGKKSSRNHVVCARDLESNASMFVFSEIIPRKTGTDSRNKAVTPVTPVTCSSFSGAS